MRWLRFARLLIACLAFVLGRPAPAEAALLDEIVLVGERRDDATPEPVVGREAAPGDSRVAPRLTASSPTARYERARFVHRPYLRHCVLLR